MDVPANKKSKNSFRKIKSSDIETVCSLQSVACFSRFELRSLNESLKDKFGTKPSQEMLPNKVNQTKEKQPEFVYGLTADENKTLNKILGTCD